MLFLCHGDMSRTRAHTHTTHLPLAWLFLLFFRFSVLPLHRLFLFHCDTRTDTCRSSGSFFFSLFCFVSVCCCSSCSFFFIMTHTHTQTLAGRLALSFFPFFFRFGVLLLLVLFLFHYDTHVTHHAMPWNQLPRLVTPPCRMQGKKKDTRDTHTHAHSCDSPGSFFLHVFPSFFRFSVLPLLGLFLFIMTHTHSSGSFFFIMTHTHTHTHTGE